MGKKNKLLKHENNLKRYVEDKFNNKFDVSKIKWRSSKEHVILICDEHGEFTISPNRIKESLYGCPKCARIEASKKTTKGNERFKVEAKIIHGDRYIYDLVDYKHSEIPVDIICRIHGIFKQTPHAHLKGQNCFKCSRVVAIEKTKLTPETYFERANLKHNYKFDYTNSKYLGTAYPITYICPEHGEVTQNAGGHLDYGCERCGHDTKVVPFEEFVERAMVIHKGLYTYLKEGYTNISSKIKCICNKHGIFEQVGDDHLKGSGCPMCKQTTGEKEIAYFLNKFGLDFIIEYKIKDSNYRFDFYIPILNVLIEYDGIQHFIPIKFFGGIKNYEYVKRSDKEKNLLAKINGYNLIRVPYTELNNINKFLIHNLTKLYPYYVDGKYFTKISDLIKYIKPPDDATFEWYKPYVLKNILNTICPL